MKIKKIVPFCLILVLSASIFAVTDSEARTLLKMAEANTAFFESDFTAQCIVVQDKPGEDKSETRATLHRRDKTSKWTILINAPEKDKGKGYLQSDETVWFYDPADGRFTFTSARDTFQGTNANTSDFAPQYYARNYKIEKHSEVKLGSYDCVLVELTASVKNVEYPKMRLWISKNDGFVRKREDYSLSGKKLRTLAIPSYQSVSLGSEKRSVPVNMVIQDELRGKKIGGKMQNERTTIVLSSPSFSKLDDSVYTKPYLELMSAR